VRAPSHPPGQTLVVTSGVGRVQRDGGPIEKIRCGDIVTIVPGEKQWRGVGPNTAMTHVTITESLDGNNTDWLESVTDAQYSG
jgi:quercetin dioxygenase-like cupin family protein